MISSDDDPPPDPQNFHVFKINSYEKDDASISEPEFDLDLFKSLVADLNDTNNPLPSFCIRDYVFNSRSKDITCNWPFSHKTLQTCLQHGVKNLLPPFESLELLRNSSSVENRPSDEEIVTSSNGKPIHEVISITSLSTKSNSELTIKESLKASSSGRQTHLQEDLTHTKSKKTTLVSSRKTENPIKKCRLGAKSSIGVEPIEIVSETMASKVCPVCKTFSSSSNTTLNAHIDQCLSGESNMKWNANPKVIVKHRIKPRKTRLMVDIYKTAPHCTVEELDARNGTSWANNSSFPTQELEFQGEEEKEENDKEEKEDKEVCEAEEKEERQGKSAIHPQVADHEGAVYIDTNGTKVRILSVPKVVTSNDHGARKLLKGGKLTKGLIEKKQKKKTQEQKYLKLSPSSKKPCKPTGEPNSSEVAIEREENVRKEAINHQVFTKKDDLPIVRPPWACSKRTDLAKKLRGNLHVTHNATKKSSVECVLRTPNKTQPNKAMDCSPISHYAKKRSPLLQKLSSKNLKKKGTFSNDSGDDQDPLDACPLKHFKASEFKSKGKKKLSVSRESASKIYLKRKLSALKRSRVVEEETSSESMNLPDASRSSNGDPSCDVESVGYKIEGIDVPKSFMALNPEATKVVNMLDSQEMNCADLIEKAMRVDTVTDDIERQQTYVPEVDPMLIPEPPGSLLFPISEQLQRNSSLVNNTSEEHHHHHENIDRDSMSDSPISTISNPSLARSDSDKFFVRSTSLKEDHTRGGFSGAMVDAINDKYAPTITSTNSVDHWRSKGTVSGFKNDQPCCCSRKENASSSYHESTFLRKPVGESFNFRPQMFSISNYPIPPPPPPPPIFPESSECDSVRSPSKPVLRLMGKNLTVVKSDEDESMFRPPPQINPLPQFSNVKNEYNFSSLGYHHVQNPVTFNQNQNGGESHSHSHAHAHAQYQYPMFQPPNNWRSSHSTLDTMYRSSSYVDHSYSHGSPMMNRFVDGQGMTSGSHMRKKEVIIIDDSPGDHDTRRNWGSGYPSQSSNNGSNFQTCLPFREVVNNHNNDNLGKWNHTQTASSRSSVIYYPPSFS